MAISHDLSSEIATALFAAEERTPAELDKLKKMVFQIYSTLEQLTVAEHPARQTSAAAAKAGAAARTNSEEVI